MKHGLTIAATFFLVFGLCLAFLMRDLGPALLSSLVAGFLLLISTSAE